jgi:hypothetical protein
MNEARRRRQKQHGRTPPPGPRRVPAASDAGTTPAAQAPEAWPRRGLLVLGVLALSIHLLGALITMRGPNFPFATALNNPVFVVVSFPLAEPFARRFGTASRRLRMMESLSVGMLTAVAASVAYTALAFIVLTLRHGVPPDQSNPVWVAAVTATITGAFVAAPPFYPRFRRLFLSPRMRRKESE